jgi:Na+-transporting NADH:ubiquinone oxidoreductase subunit A
VVHRSTIKRGLRIPISGEPTQEIEDGPQPQSVGLVGDDYIGMKPTMVVQEGDHVRRGQLLFDDKKNAGVRYTAPAAGRIAAINRGEKRKFQSLVIELDGDEHESFKIYDDHNLASLERGKIVDNLLASGLWPALRTRPYSRVASPNDAPKSIFVTAMDTNPLAADPAVVLKEPDYERFFVHGLQALTALTDGEVYLCQAPGAEIPGAEIPGAEIPGGETDGVRVAEFGGPHPAGLPGTHIHFLDAVNENKTVWHIGYQDVVAVGHLFLKGQLMAERVISLAGPIVDRPRLIRSQVGAQLGDLVTGVEADDARIISGSVLSGRQAVEPTDFLGRYHIQVSLIKEGLDREMFGWAGPGFGKFSVTRAFVSALTGFAGDGKRFSTSTEGSVRAIVPIGSYEKVMPLDIIATPLLKSLLVQDTDTAQMLGCLELDEEDLALCTFVCPGKNDYGPLLRQSLNTIEREG